jgi:hypothetical protein
MILIRVMFSVVEDWVLKGHPQYGQLLIRKGSQSHCVKYQSTAWELARHRATGG